MRVQPGLRLRGTEKQIKERLLIARALDACEVPGRKEIPFEVLNLEHYILTGKLLTEE